MSEKLIRDFLILWATIDPIGTLAIFAAVTGKLDHKARRKTATKAIVYAAVILIGAIIAGQVLLSAMGIRLVSLQLAGGIILFLFGLKMLFGRPLAEESHDGESGHDLAVFPLAIPSIATPGAILAVILLTDNHAYSIQQQLGTSIVLIVILSVTFFLMRSAGPILKVIGVNGAEILVRIMGMILAALSIELIMEALDIPKWINSAS